MESGKQLGPYIIDREVGRGGMGVVYLARDPQLDRPVAIKVLPDALSQDPERLARFEREARLLASLNHPNIAGIYGIEEAEGARFLCLEYVEGPTLQDHLARGPLAVDEAVDIGRQMAAALEAAHESGVIHRDLKPANVKIMPDGTVKVLDFGLAKDTAESDGSSPDLSHSPTLTSPVSPTLPGVILGTAAYMSPEQARGKPMDRRTDIFSFGCVMYECLTGKQLFAGETVSDTIARILERQPDWDALPGNTPERVVQILQRCLEKDPRKRQRDIGDVRLSLEDVKEGRGSGLRTLADHEMGGRKGSGRSAALAWVVATVAIAAAAIGFLRPTGDPAPESTFHYRITPPPEINLFTPTFTMAISPDGRSIAWQGNSDGTAGIYIQPIGGLEARRLPGTDLANFPFWSPDSRFIGFTDGSKLRRVPIDGGEPRILCDASSNRGNSWGDGTIVFSVEQGPLYKVAETGGAPEPATTLNEEKGETAHRFPHFLPDGKTFLYVALPGRSGLVTIYATDTEGREPVEVMQSVAQPVYAEPGYLIYQRGNRILASRFDAESLTLSGEPVDIGQAPRRPNAVGAPAVTVSSTGTLAFMETQQPISEFVWLDLDGEVIETLDVDPGPYTAPSISPDQRYVAVTREVSPEERDIWLLELDRMILNKLTSGPGNKADPTWSPDATRIVYSCDVDGPWNLFRLPIAGGNAERLTTGPATFKNALDWSPDGQWILYEQIGTGTNMDLWVVPADGSSPEKPYLEEVHQEEHGQFSPDGNWLAYTSTEAGAENIYLNSFPDPVRKLRLSVDWGVLPLWKTPNTVVFKGRNSQIHRVSVTTEPTPRAGSDEALFEWRGWYNLDLAPDGERFLGLRQVELSTPNSILMRLNWLSDFPELTD